MANSIIGAGNDKELVLVALIDIRRLVQGMNSNSPAVRYGPCPATVCWTELLLQSNTLLLNNEFFFFNCTTYA